MSDQAQYNGSNSSTPLQLRDILTPHDHDVLSGRGNFVNYHAGNEHFRALVRKHKVAYVACPKPQKGKFSRLIVDEIRSRDPPGRFLKQDPDTKLWHDIGDKKALDKTRQALREGAPELLKELQNSDEEDEERGPTGRPIPVARGQTGPYAVGDNRGYHPGGLVANQMPPPSVVTSSVALGVPSLQQQQTGRQPNQSRVVPGLINLPNALDPMAAVSSEAGGFAAVAAGSGVEDAHKQYAQANIFGVEQFEPTPINPNMAMRISGNESISSKSSGAGAGGGGGSGGADGRPGMERSDSLKFEALFSKEKEPANKKMQGSSNHLSAMSFSIGDMTDDSNLSAVFEDSLRISDDQLPDSGAGRLATGMRRTKATPASVGSSTDDYKKMNMSGALDMSLATFSEGSAGMGNSMNNLSIRGFEDVERTDAV